MENIYISNELKGHFLRLYQMALSDDQFNILELKMLYNLADNRGIPKSELDSILLNPVIKETSIPKDLNIRIEYLYDLACMILADGIITQDEKIALKKYCRKFEFLEENIEELTDFLLDCVQKEISKEDIIKQLNS